MRLMKALSGYFGAGLSVAMVSATPISGTVKATARPALLGCELCNSVTIMHICWNDASHKLQYLSPAEAGSYARVGHDSFVKVAL